MFIARDTQELFLHSVRSAMLYVDPWRSMVLDGIPKGVPELCCACGL